MLTRRHGARYVLCILIGILLLCGEESTKPDVQDDPDPVVDNSLIGTWETIIPPRPGSDDTITVGFDLADSSTWSSSDSSFYLYAFEHPDKYLYKRTGAWRMQGTSVSLSGTTCTMIDINDTSYKLIDAVDSICNLVISIDTTDSTEKIDSAWNDIPLVNLGGIVKAFPLYKIFPGWCESLRPDFLKDKNAYRYSDD